MPSSEPSSNVTWTSSRSSNNAESSLDLWHLFLRDQISKNNNEEPCQEQPTTEDQVCQHRLQWFNGPYLQDKHWKTTTPTLMAAQSMHDGVVGGEFKHSKQRRHGWKRLKKTWSCNTSTSTIQTLMPWIGKHRIMSSPEVCHPVAPTVAYSCQPECMCVCGGATLDRDSTRWLNLREKTAKFQATPISVFRSQPSRFEPIWNETTTITS